MKMDDITEKRNEVINNIRKCLQSDSAQNGCLRLNRLNVVYSQQIFSNIPYGELGYDNLKSMLMDMNDVVEIFEQSGESLVRAVAPKLQPKVTKNSQHLDQALNKHKRNTRKNNQVSTPTYKLPPLIERNISKILLLNPEGIPKKLLGDMYYTRYGSHINYTHLGFDSMDMMINALVGGSMTLKWVNDEERLVQKIQSCQSNKTTMTSHDREPEKPRNKSGKTDESRNISAPGTARVTNKSTAKMRTRSRLRAQQQRPSPNLDFITEQMSLAMRWHYQDPSKSGDHTLNDERKVKSDSTLDVTKSKKEMASSSHSLKSERRSSDDERLERLHSEDIARQIEEAVLNKDKYLDSNISLSAQHKALPLVKWPKSSSNSDVCDSKPEPSDQDGGQYSDQFPEQHPGQCPEQQTVMYNVESQTTNNIGLTSGVGGQVDGDSGYGNTEDGWMSSQTSVYSESGEDQIVNTAVQPLTIPVDAVLTETYDLSLTPPHSPFTFYLSTVESVGRFWIHLTGEEYYDALEKLMKDLDFYKTREATKYALPPSMACPGQVCVAKCSADDYWHRVIITDTISKSLVVEVFFVDYGSFETVESSQLMFLRQIFLSLPAQAIPASLFSIAPLDESGGWSQASRERFIQLCTDYWNFQRVGSVQDVEDDGSIAIYFGLRLFDEGGNLVKEISMNDELVRDGLVRMMASPDVDLVDLTRGSDGHSVEEALTTSDCNTAAPLVAMTAELLPDVPYLPRNVNGISAPYLETERLDQLDQFKCNHEATAGHSDSSYGNIPHRNTRNSPAELSLSSDIDQRSIIQYAEGDHQVAVPGAMSKSISPNPTDDIDVNAGPYDGMSLEDLHTLCSQLRQKKEDLINKIRDGEHSSDKVIEQLEVLGREITTVRLEIKCREKLDEPEELPDLSLGPAPQASLLHPNDPAIILAAMSKEPKTLRCSDSGSYTTGSLCDENIRQPGGDSNASLYGTSDGLTHHHMTMPVLSITHEQMATPVSSLTYPQMATPVSSIAYQQMATPVSSIAYQQMATPVSSIAYQQMATPVSSLTYQQMATPVSSLTYPQMATPVSSIAYQQMATPVSSITYQQMATPVSSIAYQQMATPVSSIAYQQMATPVSSIAYQQMATPVSSIAYQQMATPVSSIAYQQMATPVSSIAYQQMATPVSSIAHQHMATPVSLTYEQMATPVSSIISIMSHPHMTAPGSLIPQQLLATYPSEPPFSTPSYPYFMTDHTPPFQQPTPHNTSSTFHSHHPSQASTCHPPAPVVPLSVSSVSSAPSSTISQELGYHDISTNNSSLYPHTVSPSPHTVSLYPHTVSLYPHTVYSESHVTHPLTNVSTTDVTLPQQYVSTTVNQRLCPSCVHANASSVESHASSRVNDKGDLTAYSDGQCVPAAGSHPLGSTHGLCRHCECRRSSPMVSNSYNQTTVTTSSQGQVTSYESLSASPLQTGVDSNVCTCTTIPQSTPDLQEFLHQLQLSQQQTGPLTAFSSAGMYILAHLHGLYSKYFETAAEINTIHNRAAKENPYSGLTLQQFIDLMAQFQQQQQQNPAPPAPPAASTHAPTRTGTPPSN